MHLSNGIDSLTDMGFIGIIIVGGIILLVGYGLLLEYFSNEDIRPVYHLIFGVLAILVLVAMCTGGCS